MSSQTTSHHICVIDRAVIAPANMALHAGALGRGGENEGPGGGYWTPADKSPY